MIDWLQNWYLSQCNGDWEHGYGIKIETIDNPGWELTIDLENTDFQLEDIEWKIIGNFENEWYGYKVKNNQFNGACSPLNLTKIIEVFKNMVSSKLV